MNADQLCYNIVMRFGKRHNPVVCVVAAFVAAIIGFAAVARGAELCFCESDPDGCGHACHECGAAVPDGISHDEGCHHLELDETDLVVADTSVSLPVLMASVVQTPLGTMLSVHRDVRVPSAAGPPGPRFYLSHRFCVLCPRS